MFDHIRNMQKSDLDLLMRKNKAYGNDVLIRTGVHGVAIRMMDKTNRLLNLLQNPDVDAGDEPIEDTLADLANYSYLARAMKDGALQAENDKINSVYLGGPIDLEEPNYAGAWRENVAHELAGYGIATFNPYAAWTGVNEVMHQDVMDIDFLAVERCDAMIANLPTTIPTLGTIREIERARSLGKRVLVVSSWAGTSAFSADLEVYATFDEAIEALVGSKVGHYSIGNRKVPMPDDIRAESSGPDTPGVGEARGDSDQNSRIEPERGDAGLNSGVPPRRSFGLRRN